MLNFEPQIGSDQTFDVMFEISDLRKSSLDTLFDTILFKVPKLVVYASSRLKERKYFNLKRKWAS